MSSWQSNFAQYICLCGGYHPHKQICVALSCREQWGSCPERKAKWKDARGRTGFACLVALSCPSNSCSSIPSPPPLRASNTLSPASRTRDQRDDETCLLGYDFFWWIFIKFSPQSQNGEQRCSPFSFARAFPHQLAGHSVFIYPLYSVHIYSCTTIRRQLGLGRGWVDFLL